MKKLTFYIYRPMDVPRLTKQAIKNTIEGLKNAEERNKLPFSDWPKNTWTEYDLQPERVGQVQACHLPWSLL